MTAQLPGIQRKREQPTETTSYGLKPACWSKLMKRCCHAGLKYAWNCVGTKMQTLYHWKYSLDTRRGTVGGITQFTPSHVQLDPELQDITMGNLICLAVILACKYTLNRLTLWLWRYCVIYTPSVLCVCVCWGTVYYSLMKTNKNSLMKIFMWNYTRIMESL